MVAEYRHLLGEKVVFTNELGEEVRGVVTELRYPHGKEPRAVVVVTEDREWHNVPASSVMRWFTVEK